MKTRPRRSLSLECRQQHASAAAAAPVRTATVATREARSSLAVSAFRKLLLTAAAGVVGALATPEAARADWSDRPEAGFLTTISALRVVSSTKLKTAGWNEAEPPAAAWDGKLPSLQFSGSVPNPTSISAILSVVSFTENETFAATAGTADQSLYIGPAVAGAAPIAGALRINAAVTVTISGNNESAIRIAPGSALHVGAASGTTGTGTFFVKGNSALFGGGLLAEAPAADSTAGALARFESTEFSTNKAVEITLTPEEGGGTKGGSGGAIYAERASLLEFVKTRFVENEAKHGGAVYAQGGTLAFHSGTEFTKNKADEHGGGIHAIGGVSFTASSVEFTENTAQLGGALYARDEKTTGTVSGSKFTNNAASQHGGALYLGEGATLQLGTSTFTGNTAAATGGAISLSGATLTAATRTSSDTSEKLLGNTFKANTASAGGGGAIYADNAASVALTDGVFTQNKAATVGGAIHLDNGSGAHLLVSAGKEFLFTGNTAAAAPNSIHVTTGTAAEAKLEFVSTATGVINLLDPMSGHAGAAAATTGAIAISKTGEGELRLAGASHFTTEAGTESRVTFDLVAGTLTLARAGVANPTVADPAAVTTAGALHLGAASTFKISATGTLAVTTANTLEASAFELHRNGKLLFDFNGAANAATGGAQLTLLGGNENLILDTSTLVLRNFASLDDGAHILVDAAATTAAITETSFAAAETLVLDDISGATGFRAPDGTARTLTLAADTAARHITLNVTTSATPAGAADLTWTGKIGADTWAHADPAANWTGKTADGLAATTFRDGDAITFGDTTASAEHPNPVTSTARTLTLTGTVRPGNVSFNNNQTPLTLTGGVIESTGTLTLTAPAGVTLKDTTASFATGIALNHAGSSTSNYPLTLDNATLATAADATLHGALYLGAPPPSGDPAPPATTGSLTAHGNITLHGYATGDGTLSADGTIIIKNYLIPGSDANLSPGNGATRRGTINLAGHVQNEGVIYIKYLADLTHDTLRNVGDTPITLGGDILFFVNPAWLETSDTLEGFLERDPAAATIALSHTALLSFVDPTMHGTIVDAATGSIRITRKYSLPGARDGLADFVNELCTLAYQGSGYGVILLGLDGLGYNVDNVAAASPLGYAAIPALLHRAATDTTAVLNDHVASRRAAREFQSVKPTPDGVEFFVAGTGNNHSGGGNASDPFFDYNSGSVILGLDTFVSKNVLLGASVGGHFAQARFHAGAGKVDHNEYRGTLYASYAPDAFEAHTLLEHLVAPPTITATLSGGVSRLETRRNVTLRNEQNFFNFRNGGATSASDLGATLHISKPIAIAEFAHSPVYITPRVGIEYLYMLTEAFRENGELAEGQFRLSGLDQQSLQLDAGLALTLDAYKDSLPWRFHLVAEYQRQLLDTTADLRARLYRNSAATRFTVPAAYLSRELFQFGPTLEIGSAHSVLSFSYRYETTFSTRLTHHLRAEYRIRF